MYCKYLGKDVEELKKELRPDAEKKVKTRLIVEAVAEAEKMEATKEDIEKELAAMADMYKMEVEKLRQMMGVDNFSYMMQDIKMRKAIDFLFENAVIE